MPSPAKDDCSRRPYPTAKRSPIRVRPWSISPSRSSRLAPGLDDRIGCSSPRRCRHLSAVAASHERLDPSDTHSREREYCPGPVVRRKAKPGTSAGLHSCLALGGPLGWARRGHRPTASPASSATPCWAGAQRRSPGSRRLLRRFPSITRHGPRSRAPSASCR